jgi:hypothetical protein
MKVGNNGIDSKDCLFEISSQSMSDNVILSPPQAGEESRRLSA